MPENAVSEKYIGAAENEDFENKSDIQKDRYESGNLNPNVMMMMMV